jgi:hypothetical protein
VAGPPLVFKLTANPFAASYAFRIIGSLFAVWLLAAGAAWLLSRWWGDSALLAVVMALPLVSLALLLRESRRQARSGGLAGELLISEQRIELKPAKGQPLLRAQRQTLRAEPRIYLAGGRTVMRLPCIELAFESGPVTLATAAPSLLWPFEAERCSVTPSYLVSPEAWPELLHALDIAARPRHGAS